MLRLPAKLLQVCFELPLDLGGHSDSRKLLQDGVDRL